MKTRTQTENSKGIGNQYRSNQRNRNNYSGEWQETYEPNTNFNTGSYGDEDYDYPDYRDNWSDDGAISNEGGSYGGSHYRTGNYNSGSNYARGEGEFNNGSRRGYNEDQNRNSHYNTQEEDYEPGRNFNPNYSHDYRSNTRNEGDYYGNPNNYDERNRRYENDGYTRNTDNYGVNSDQNRQRDQNTNRNYSRQNTPSYRQDERDTDNRYSPYEPDRNERGYDYDIYSDRGNFNNQISGRTNSPYGNTRNFGNSRNYSNNNSGYGNTGLNQNRETSRYNSGQDYDIRSGNPTSNRVEGRGLGTKGRRAAQYGSHRERNRRQE